MVEELRRGEIIAEDQVRELCFLAREILLEEGNVQRVDAPVTVRGGENRTRWRGRARLDLPFLDMRGYPWTVL